MAKAKARSTRSRRAMSGGARRRTHNRRRTRPRRRTRRRSRRRGGVGLTAAASAAVLPFGLLWAQRAYKGKHGKSLKKIYRH